MTEVGGVGKLHGGRGHALNMQLSARLNTVTAFASFDLQISLYISEPMSGGVGCAI